MSTPSEALAVACGSQASIWRPFAPKEDQLLQIQHNDQCRSVQWNHNNKVLASGGKYGRLALHYHNAGLMGVLPKEEDGQRFAPINDLSFSRGSKLIAIGCDDHTVQVWDLKTQVRAMRSPPAACLRFQSVRSVLVSRGSRVYDSPRPGQMSYQAAADQLSPKLKLVISDLCESVKALAALRSQSLATVAFPRTMAKLAMLPW